MIRFVLGLVGPFIAVKLVLYWMLLVAAIVGMTPYYSSPAATAICSPHSLCNLDVFLGVILVFVSPLFAFIALLSKPIIEFNPVRAAIKISLGFWLLIFWEFFIFSPAIISPSTDTIEFWRLPAFIAFMLTPFVVGIIVISNIWEERYQEVKKENKR